MPSSKISYERFGIYIADMNPVKGREINKTRPVIVISPDEMNEYLATVIIAPLTTTIRSAYPFRIQFQLNKTESHIALDQLRCVDKTRLIKKVGKLDTKVSSMVTDVLGKMFA